jgi:hypothetical protein
LVQGDVTRLSIRRERLGAETKRRGAKAEMKRRLKNRGE